MSILRPRDKAPLASMVEKLSAELKKGVVLRNRGLLEHCGIEDYRLGEDALYELYASGKAVVNPDSTIAWAAHKKHKSARHSRETPRWGTEASYVERARSLFGGRIGLDPMSEACFQEVVRADRYLTEADDCFRQHWTCDSMLINPAGGLFVRAWRYLVREYTEGRVRRAVWVGFSVEQLAILAGEPVHPDDYSKLSCRKRISFYRHDGYVGSPSHANYIAALGVPAEDFEREFAGLGRFSHGHLAITGAPGRVSSVTSHVNKENQ